MTRASASDWRTTSSKCSPKLRGELYGAHTQPHGHHTPPENQRPPLHTMRAAGLFLYAQHSKTEPPHQPRQAGPDKDHTQRPRHTRGAAPAAGPGKPRQVTTRAPSRRTNTAEKRKRKKNTNAGHPAKENKKIFTGPFELNFSLRCLRAQKHARLIEKF